VHFLSSVSFIFFLFCFLFLRIIAVITIEMAITAIKPIPKPNCVVDGVGVIAGALDSSGVLVGSVGRIIFSGAAGFAVHDYDSAGFP
jgi:hypothetical protein